MNLRLYSWDLMGIQPTIGQNVGGSIKGDGHQSISRD
jgi:hypothetical protein